MGGGVAALEKKEKPESSRPAKLDSQSGWLNQVQVHSDGGLGLGDQRAAQE